MGSVLGWAANSVLFVLGCLLAADTANEVIAATVLAPSEEISAPAPRDVAVRQRTWNERKIILDRNLFKSSTEAAVVPTQEPIENVEKSRLPMTLLGTYASSDASESRATLKDREKNETLVVGVGDQLRGQALVLRIERRRVVLQENGVPRELTLEEEASGQKGASRARTARRAPPRRPARPAARRQEPVKVSREDIEKNMRDPSNLLTQARVQPKFENGEMVGLQVSGIKTGSLFEEIGLAEGDIITEFNGIPIDSPEERLNIFQELENADEFHVIGRGPDGQERTWTFTPE